MKFNNLSWGTKTTSHFSEQFPICRCLTIFPVFYSSFISLSAQEPHGADDSLQWDTLSTSLRSLGFASICLFLISSKPNKISQWVVYVKKCKYNVITSQIFVVVIFIYIKIAPADLSQPFFFSSPCQWGSQTFALLSPSNWSIPMQHSKPWQRLCKDNLEERQTKCLACYSVY